jgi:RNA polymerase sigma-70 factor, ECF subfamily
MPQHSTAAPAHKPAGSLGSFIPSVTSLTLLQQAREQDPAAWRRLVRLYGPLVFLWCLRDGASRHDAEDVTQEVWLAVAKKLPEFRRDERNGSFRGWLRIITRRKLCDHWANSGPPPIGGSEFRSLLEEFPDKICDSAEQVAGDNALLVRGALKLIQADFEPGTWRAFWRTAVDGQPSPDIAAELKITAGAVREAKRRVLRRLREELDGLLD